LLGAFLCALILACVGSVPGAIFGSLLHGALRRLRWPSPGAFFLPLAGAIVGAVLYLLLDDWDGALSGVAWGAGIGLIGAPLLLVGVGPALDPGSSQE
jgi:hypothetical protein